jgi:hypothetical protein
MAFAVVSLSSLVGEDGGGEKQPRIGLGEEPVGGGQLDVEEW